MHCLEDASVSRAALDLEVSGVTTMRLYLALAFYLIKLLYSASWLFPSTSALCDAKHRPPFTPPLPSHGQTLIHYEQKGFCLTSGKLLVYSMYDIHPYILPDTIAGMSSDHGECQDVIMLP